MVRDCQMLVMQQSTIPYLRTASRNVFTFTEHRAIDVQKCSSFKGRIQIIFCARPYDGSIYNSAHSGPDNYIYIIAKRFWHQTNCRWPRKLINVISFIMRIMIIIRWDFFLMLRSEFQYCLHNHDTKTTIGNTVPSGDKWPLPTHQRRIHVRRIYIPQLNSLFTIRDIGCAYNSFNCV